MMISFKQFSYLIKFCVKSFDFRAKLRDSTNFFSNTVNVLAKYANVHTNGVNVFTQIIDVFTESIDVSTKDAQLKAESVHFRIVYDWIKNIKPLTL